MLRRLLGPSALCALLLACSGKDRPPAIDLDPNTSAGGASGDGGDQPGSGGKKSASGDLREGGFINLPQVSDILYDDLRGRLYVSTTQGGLATIKLEDGKIATQKIGDGPLLGLDLSPSGKKLSICENSVDEDAKQYWIHVADLEENSLREYYFDQDDDLQEGTHGAAFADDDTLFLSTSYKAGGYVPLMRLQLGDGASEQVDAVAEDTMFARSLDNSTLLLSESDAAGPIEIIDTSTLAITEGYVNVDLHDGAINADASKLAFPAREKLKIVSKDASGGYSVEAQIEEPGRDARAAIFSPVSGSIYVTWSRTLEGGLPFVARYDAETLESQGVVLKGIKLADVRLGGFPPTRMRISNDGTLLFVTVETGINVIPVEP